VGLAAPGTLRIAMRRCVQGINYDQPESICACGVFGELERRFCIRSGRTRGPASWKLIGHLRRQRRRGSNQRHLQLQTRVSVGNRSGQRGLVGGTVGWNWQSGNWVFGVEGDLSATNIQGGTGGGNCGSSFICKAEIGWLGTARARLGLATMGNALFYVTGGGAWASQNRADLLPGVGQFNEWKNASGWTAGGGAEFLVNPHWTVKTEALWVDLNSVSYAGGISPSGGIFAAGHMDVNFFVFRGGVNYKF